MAPLRAMVQPYLAPFDLEHAVVAHRTTFVEHGNWKLVMENNRECYHCRAAHPELCMSFPSGAQHAGAGDPAELAAIDSFVADAEAHGLPGRFQAADDHQYRVMRLPLEGATSMTMDGQPAIRDRRFGVAAARRRPRRRAAVPLPLDVEPLHGRPRVDVPAAAARPDDVAAAHDVARPRGHRGVDAGPTFERLTEVWLATNAQDATLVERAQRGVVSPAYRPGPYSPVEEDGVMQFVDWYAARMTSPARAPAIAVAVGEAGQ